MKVYPPLYLLKAETACWKCKERQNVVGLATHRVCTNDEDDAEDVRDDADLITLNNIESMPEQVIALVRQRAPSYELRSSRTAGQTYFQNVCKCGANLGDFFLFSEPEGAFFPMTKDAAEKVEIELLPVSDPLDFSASFGQGGAGLIWQYGARAKEKPGS